MEVAGLTFKCSSIKQQLVLHGKYLTILTGSMKRSDFCKLVDIEPKLLSGAAGLDGRRYM